MLRCYSLEQDGRAASDNMWHKIAATATGAVAVHFDSLP